MRPQVGVVSRPRTGSATIRRAPRAAAVKSRSSSGDGGAGKMFVPSDGFGGVSPERKAAEMLRTFHTFVAVRVVMAQLEGSGRGALGSYNAEYYQMLADHLQEVPMKNGDEWLESLMLKNQLLGVRISEVRAAYAESDFEWEQLRRLALEGTKEANVALMRKTLAERTASSWEE
mmetsp:Transcript_20598/g.51885  ORF Transcript_20598/g.51885 Transcript_20598/m.51885 type:complete len:174 (-) Transcript_20598:1046-1567(-)